MILSINFQVRNLNNAALVVELAVPTGLVDVQKATAVQHNIIPILVPLDGLLHLEPTRGGDDHGANTMVLNVFKKLYSLVVFPKP